MPVWAGTTSTVGSTGFTVSRVSETYTAPMGSSANYFAECPSGSKVLSGTIYATSGAGSITSFWIDDSTNRFYGRWGVPNIAPATLEVTATCIAF